MITYVIMNTEPSYIFQQYVLLILVYCKMKKKKYYYYFCSMGFMLKVILLRSNHSLSASRFSLLSQEVKESMSYVKDPIEYFVTSQKNYF